MSILGFDTILENAGETVNFNEAVDVENGGVEEAMEECAFAVHAIFEAMYSNDSSEISAVTESAISGEELEEIVTEGVGAKIGGAIKSAYETMKNAVLKVINGFIELVNKLKLDSKKFVAQVARSEKAAEVKISGYTFPSSTMNFSLSACFTKFSSAVGAYGAIDFATKNNSAENLTKLFNEKKVEGLKAVKEFLGGDDFKKAAFGEKKELTINTKDAMVQVAKVCDQRIADLKKQKSDVSKTFDQCIKSLRGMESDVAKPQLGKNPGAAGKAPALMKPFAAAHNAVKSLYVSRLSVEIKAAKARRDMYISAIKKAVALGKKAAKDGAKASKKEENK